MKKLIRQVLGFIGISGIGWILDLCTYTVLGLVSDHLFVNNMISSWVGVTFVFAFATWKVFRNNSRIPLPCKYLIYLVYQFILILLVSKILTVVDAFIVSHITVALIVSFSSIIAKIFITPITMVLNFLVMKGIMEKI